MNPADRVSAFQEALPYLQRFRGSTFVIKYGGSAMEDEARVDAVLRDVVLLEAVGINPVLVHGGGKAITRALQQEGVGSHFIDGLRVTGADAIAAIDRTLAREIGPGIARRIQALGGKAEALSGKEVLRARKLAYRKDGKAVDLGFVGDVTRVVAPPLRRRVAAEVVPVISPLAVGRKGGIYNINADTAACEVAVALRAEKLIYLTDVNGVLRDAADPASTIPALDPAAVARLKAEGVIAGGMIPKVDGAVGALERGVGKVHFLNGGTPHALLLEIFTDAGIGTEFHL
ncbi:MAG: acetylglutamate kinase [Verrucomicrobium sp.]|nr:acetylglutamate kinase [Verrucomicrobium sp.]